MFTTVNSLGVELPYYGIMTALGISACFLLIHFTKNKRENIDSIEYLLISLAGAGFAFILSHMLYAIAHYKKILFIVTHPDRLFESLQSFVFYFSDIFVKLTVGH